MGQIISFLTRWRSRRHMAQPPPCLFLEQPADIVLYLCQEHLPPASILSLSLTCKSLFSLVPWQPHIRANSPDREEFLLLLEKDLGHNRFYCHACSILHRFWPAERSPLQSTICTQRPGKHEFCSRRRVFLRGSRTTLGFQHVRLAMNRHFLGPPNGLPLDKLRLETTSTHRPLYWTEKWSARILQDELFLSATRTFCHPDKTEQEIRYAVDNNSHSICCHVSTAFYAHYSMSALHLGPLSTGLFIPCRDVVESCPKCLTDYDTTVEQRWIEVKEGTQKRMKPYWSITVTSYHRLGDGRSPLDPKWHAFAARGIWTVELYSRKRDMVQYPQGSVRQMWKQADS